MALFALPAMPAWVATIADYAMRGGKALWASVAALMTSPSVWLACAAVFVGGFMTGHWERNMAVKALKEDMATVTADRDNLARSYRDMTINANRALKEARDAKAELEAAKVILEAKRQSVARSSPAKPKTKEALK